MDRRRPLVGIMTLYFNYNYGALLQAYSLQKIINEMGYTAEDIRYYREINGESTFQVSGNKKIYKCIFKRTIFKSIIRKILEKNFHIEDKISNRRNYFDDFIKDELKESKNLYDGHINLESCSEAYDIFICGSDNIWNKNLLDTAFMLDFVPDNKLKIAYSPGMSTNSLTPEQEEIIHFCVSRLHYVSCRETSGANLLSELTGQEVPVLLDPTLLKSDIQWCKLEKRPDLEKLPNNYIFCYFCGEEKIARDKANELKKLYKLPIITLPDITGHLEVRYIHFGDIRLYNAGPKEFLYLIHHATYVCTDSYHGTIFSIIYKKKFACFRRFADDKNRSLNYRIDNILDQLKINDQCIIKNRSDNMSIAVNTYIDWFHVDELLTYYKKHSLDFIKNALSDKDHKLKG